MQGLYFLFSIWTIILLYSRNKVNSKVKFFNISILLLLITCSTFTIELYSFQINVVYLFLIFMISYFISKLTLSEQLLHFLKGLIIGMAYSSMCILAIYDPASYFVNVFFSIPLMTTVLVLFLSKDYIERLRLLIIGLMQGEIFNFFTYRSIKIQYVIGDFSWLDSLFLTILVITILKLLSHSVSKKQLKSRKLVKN